MITIQESSELLARHLVESMATVADLPDPHVLTSFVLEGLRYQYGPTTAYLIPLPFTGRTQETSAQVLATLTDVQREALARGGALSTQVGGDHYKGMKIQHAEFCQANGLGWCESAAIKYLCRHGKKNGVEDLKKAIHYAQLCARLVYGVEI